MHIHKPKPLHGLREFLSEISVIVVGILIALALEQTVEALHWRQVRQAEVRLRADLEYDVGFARRRPAVWPFLVSSKSEHGRQFFTVECAAMVER